MGKAKRARTGGGPPRRPPGKGNAGRREPPPADAPAGENAPAGRRRPLAGLGLLVALALLAYLPALQAGFIWDDDAYVTGNALLQDAHGLERIWTEVGATPQYYPLVFTTFWLERHLWGLAPAGYHLVNVLLHGLSAFLLWRVLRRLAVPGALFAAALFAVHPVNVESVAWVTERKNVLAATLFLAALLLFLRFRPPGEPSPGWRGRAGIHYGLSLLAFLGALWSKTVACSLPAAILLLDLWKSRRPRAAVLLPLLPMFALGAWLARTTAVLERVKVGAQGEAWDLSFAERCLVAGRALWFYPGKLLWPHPLVFVYPRWRVDAGDARQVLFPVAAAAVAAALWALRRRLGAGPLTAVLLYAGMLLPALGFFDVFPMQFSFVADHFLYLAAAPLLALAAAGAALLARRLPAPARLAPAAAALAVAVLAALSFRQARVYHDVETLWRDTLAKNPEAWIAHNNLGVALYARGAVDEAIEHYEAALRLHPDFPQAHSNLAEIYLDRGEPERATPHYEALVRLAPGNAVGSYQLGKARLRQGRTDEALELFAQALRAKPGFAPAQGGRGDVFLARRDYRAAAESYAAAARLEPRETRWRFAEGAALQALGDGRGAADCLGRAVAAEPENPAALAALARLFATWPDAAVRDGARAVELAGRAARLTGEQNGMVLDTLAAAHAEAGDFAAAVAWASRAVELASARGRQDAARAFAAHLEAFRGRRPLRLGPGAAEGGIVRSLPDFASNPEPRESE